VGKLLELRDHGALGFQLRAAVGAAADVSPERGHAEAHLAVEEKIEFVWKEMPVFHDSL
jgi:hypothetical protein